jgi:predicted nucleotidyltransferase
MPKKGIKIPKVGMADALFSRTQQRVLGLVFGQPDRLYGMVELIKLAGSGSGAVQRELDRLVRSGLVSFTQDGRSRKYRANRESPLFEELRSIVEKTAGIPYVLRTALAALEPSIRYAVLYGSVAKELDTATSDIDVLIVSDELTLEAVFDALIPAEERLGRRVNPTLYTSDEYRKRRRSKHPFLTKVMSGTHVVLIGSEDELVSTR